MTPIAPQFESRGFHHTLIERIGAWALFERTKGGSVHYEVVRIRSAKAMEVYGKTYPEREVYPPSEKWGMDGFTFTDLDKAKAKLAEMAKDVAKAQGE